MATISEIKVPAEFRENMRKVFARKMNCSETSPMAINFETAVYNYAIQEAVFRKLRKVWDKPEFTQLYLDRCRSMYANLTPANITQLANGEIVPQAFPFMTHQEMNPERWSVLIDRKLKRDASKYEKRVGSSTDMFTCKKCKSKNCTYYELQTRSADEPATIFVTCLDCGKHWKS